MTKNAFTIVVGLDFGELSDAALIRALELGLREPAAEVHVISVLPAVNVDPLHVPKAILVEAELASARLQKHVASVLRDFSAAREVRSAEHLRRVVSHVRFDEPARGIAQLASDLEADLVLVGTHGRGGLSRLLLGSVAEGVLRLAPCPVLVMRPKAQLPEGPAIAAACPRCLDVRRTSGGGQLWCAQHLEKHGRRHTYHQSDRAGAETNFPLVTQ